MAIFERVAERENFAGAAEDVARRHPITTFAPSATKPREWLAPIPRQRVRTEHDLILGHYSVDKSSEALSSTKRFAVAKPIPVVPPVTTATFPCNLPITVTSLFADEAGPGDVGPTRGYCLWPCSAMQAR